MLDYRPRTETTNDLMRIVISVCVCISEILTIVKWLVADKNEIGLITALIIILIFVQLNDLIRTINILEGSCYYRESSESKNSIVMSKFLLRDNQFFS